MMASQRLQLVLTLAGVSAIVLLFVPFAFDYIPFRNAFAPDFLDPSWQDVLPCLVLPWLVSAGYFIWLGRGRLPKLFQFLCTAGAVLAVVPFVYMLIGIERPLDWSSALGLLFFIAPFVALAAFVVFGITRRPLFRGIAAMQGVYVVQLCFWIFAGYPDLQLGAWLGVVAVSSYSMQIALLADRNSWRAVFIAGVLVPLGVFYLLEVL